MKTPLFALAAAAVLSFTAGARADQIVTESVSPAAPVITTTPAPAVTESTTTVTPAAPVVTDSTTTVTTERPAISKHDQKEIDEKKHDLQKKVDKAERNATYGR